MSQRMAVIVFVAAATFLAEPASFADTPAACAPNGSTCIYASRGYANGAPGMCINAACVYCAGAACGSACMGLAGATRRACEQAVIRAQIASSKYEQAAAQEKAEMLGILQRQLREATDPGFLAHLSDSDLAAYPAKIKSEEARVAVIAADLGIPLTDTAASDAKTAEMVARERACRADQKCMDARRAAELQAELCALVAEIHDKRERMRIERANPSGVVDLAELHEDGEVIQTDQAAMAAKRPEYLKVAHKAFSEMNCK